MLIVIHSLCTEQQERQALPKNLNQIISCCPLLSFSMQTGIFASSSVYLEIPCRQDNSQECYIYKLSHLTTQHEANRTSLLLHFMSNLACLPETELISFASQLLIETDVLDMHSILPLQINRSLSASSLSALNAACQRQGVGKPIAGGVCRLIYSHMQKITLNFVP